VDSIAVVNGRGVIVAKGKLNNGSFSLTVPTPKDEELTLLSDGMSDGITLSNEATKANSGYRLIALKDGERVGSIERLALRDLEEIVAVMNIMYVDRQVDITGTDGKRIYDVKFAAGWNVIVETNVGGNSTSKYTANDEPANALWAFTPLMSY